MKIFRIPILLLMLSGCVEKLDLPDSDSAPRVVVDGLITNQAGPHEIRIFMTSPLGELLQYPTPVQGAEAVIEVSDGAPVVLTETKPGLYVTPEAFQGTVGLKYQLRFIVNDKVYESSEQEMLPAGEITEVRSEYVADAINPNDPAAIHDVMRVTMDSRGVTGAPNLYRWRWSGIFEGRTFPEYKLRRVAEGDTSFWVPDPLPCSGFTVSDDYQLVYQFPCECCTCWVDEFGTEAMVSKNNLFSQSTFNNVLIASLPLNANKFFIKYRVNVEQLSVTEDVYAFWKKLEAQQRGSSNIFQPNVIHIGGNIRCESDPGEEVSGVFAVSAVTSRAMFIHRTDIPRVLNIDSVYLDCRARYPGSTTVKPPFW